MPSLQGFFLVASPHLEDPNFMRSVVLILQHSEEGAFGLVLNRPTHNTLEEVWELISASPCKRGETIYIGGPVGGPLVALHTYESYGEAEVAKGVYTASAKENLQGLVDNNCRPMRIFTGYSGWSEGQLESELAQGGWLTAKASMSQVFADPEELWHEVVQEIGRDILSSRISTPFPNDPSMN